MTDAQAIRRGDRVVYVGPGWPGGIPPGTTGKVVQVPDAQVVKLCGDKAVVCEVRLDRGGSFWLRLRSLERLPGGAR